MRSFMKGTLRSGRAALLAAALVLGGAVWLVRAAEEVAPAAVGKVSGLEGRATAQPTEGEKRKLGLDDPVYLGDKLETGRGSSLQVKFEDGTSINLGQRAEMVIDEYVYKAGDKNSRCATSVSRGVFEVIGGAISKVAPDQVKIKTPTATIGIRGTQCVGVADSRSTTAIFTEGTAISVTNDQGNVVIGGTDMLMFGTEVKAGAAPSEPRKYSMAELQRVSSGISRNFMGNALQQAVQQGARAGMNIPTTPTTPPCR